jgi:hypothetical protein
VRQASVESRWMGDCRGVGGGFRLRLRTRVSASLPTVLLDWVGLEARLEFEGSRCLVGFLSE